MILLVLSFVFLQTVIGEAGFAIEGPTRTRVGVKLCVGDGPLDMGDKLREQAEVFL